MQTVLIFRTYFDMLNDSGWPNMLRGNSCHGQHARVLRPLPHFHHIFERNFCFLWYFYNYRNNYRGYMSDVYNVLTYVCLCESLVTWKFVRGISRANTFIAILLRVNTNIYSLSNEVEFRLMSTSDKLFKFSLTVPQKLLRSVLWITLSQSFINSHIEHNINFFY